MKTFAWRVATLSLLFSAGHAAVAAAQNILPLPPPGLQVIANDPVFGPMCAGPLGPGRCEDVRRYMMIEEKASQINLQVVGQDGFGPLCAGPLGPGPCRAVQRYLAMQELAAEQFPLQQIGNAPGIGPTCAGPLGPVPCDAIRAYLMQQQPSSPAPMQPFDAHRPQLANGNTNIVQPMCNGPSGSVPCTLVGQMSLDRFSGQIPPSSSFGVPTVGNDPQRLAMECARRVGLDVAQFAGCAGQQVILPRDQQAVLDCAVSQRDTPSFADCAAPHLGISVTADQRVLAQCAMRSRGDRNGFAACAGGNFLNRNLTADEQAILACAATAGGNAANFTNCAAPHVLDRLSDDQKTLARCAMQSKGDRNGFLGCAGGAFANRALGTKEQAVLNCALTARDDLASFAGCAAVLTRVRRNSSRFPPLVALRSDWCSHQPAGRSCSRRCAAICLSATLDPMPAARNREARDATTLRRNPGWARRRQPVHRPAPKFAPRRASLPPRSSTKGIPAASRS
jgi:hypothetical protein